MNASQPQSSLDVNSKISIFSIELDGQRKIGIRPTISAAQRQLLQSIPSFRYSEASNCYYISYAEASYHAFKSLSIPFSIEKLSGTVDDLPSKDEHTGIADEAIISIDSATAESTVPPKVDQVADVDIQQTNTEAVDISWNAKGFIIRLSYTKPTVAFLKSLKGSYWNAKYKCWIARSSIDNLKKLQSYFSAWSEARYTQIYDLISADLSPQFIKLYYSPQYPGHFLVKIGGFRADIQYIKSIPKRRYDQSAKKWILPYSHAIVTRLINHYESIGSKVVNRLPQGPKDYQRHFISNSSRVRRFLSKCPAGLQGCLLPYVELMLSQHYSWKTISSYAGKLIKLMEYYQRTTMSELGVEEIHRYLAYLARQDASNSLLNQVHSAVKLYFQQVEVIPDFDLEKLKRPRRHKKLPTILSQREVDRLLRKVTNLKHLTILYTIYGGGLRLNELLHIRVQDVHWDRNQLLVQNGKGKKQRMVMLSSTLKALLQKYFDEYQPQYWLFEGQDKRTNYSSKSVQAIVKKAARLANISRRVTPHTLRHCFATHLLDNGTDVRYIQELLGHKDIKTTLIYTHVSNHQIGQIQSPLDRLGNGRGIV